MKTTKNYGLNKPESTDFYDVNVQNENLDVIDAKLEEIESAVSDSTNNAQTHAENTDNPHNVTAHQVGLGNVPNVSTNNQTPTYTESTTLVGLTSGETLGVAFGKIAKAVKDFMSHLTNKSNPHTVNKTQVGLGNVDNTADTDKSVKYATSATNDADGNNIAKTYAKSSHGTHVSYSTTAPVMDGTASTGSATTVARSDHKHPTDTSRAPLVSPTLSGTPTAPTATSGTNTTQIATTAFVQVAKQEAINAILGGTVDADYDTLQEVAAWILSDTTKSAALITRVTNLENSLPNYLLKTGTATKATADANGNNIANTYATKSQLSTVEVSLGNIDEALPFTIVIDDNTKTINFIDR